MRYDSIDQAKAHIKTCLQDEPAYCAAACPFDFDVRDFIAKLSGGRFNAAYRTYANAVAFPGIVSALCDQPCRGACPRGRTDASIELRMLESATCAFASSTQPNSYNLPLKEAAVAVVGAGISGLACALRLCNRKYRVVVFERSATWGGHLRELLPAEPLDGEIKKQFAEESCDFRFGKEIKDPLKLLNENFAAVYVATGRGGTGEACEARGVFRGGSLCGATSMQAMAQGLAAANDIEGWIKTRAPQKKARAACPQYPLAPLNEIEKKDRIDPANGVTYSKEEAIAEAKRCLRCRCDACVRHCRFLSYFEKFPKRVEDEVEVTVHPGTLDGNGTVATRLISTCNQCGLCAEVCPLSIDTGDFLRLSHEAMRAKDAMPWAFHEFFLRDMTCANGEDAAFTSPGRCAHVFYPGCQLGASSPEYVLAPFRFLKQKLPDVGLMLGCCGAPAVWAGDIELQTWAFEKIRAEWDRMGKPVFVLACPACQEMFRRYLPEISIVSLYEKLAELECRPQGERAKHTEQAQNFHVSVFDPCMARHDTAAQDAVRNFARAAGYTLEPLFYEGQYSQCCSWGGQIARTNPPYARWLTGERTTENDLPYVCYCSNCRDIFAAREKPARHVLDVLFDIHDWNRPAPALERRLENRSAVKVEAIREHWPDRADELPQKRRVARIALSDVLAEKLDHDYLLLDDVRAVIDAAESGGRKIRDPQRKSFMAHAMVGRLTVWVEYRVRDEGYELLNAYAHRMRIEEEGPHGG